jgi:hypothetical protein
LVLEEIIKDIKMSHKILKLVITEMVKTVLEEESKKETSHAGRPRSKSAEPQVARQIDRLGGTKKVAKELGVTQGQVNKIIRGDSSTTVAHAIDLENLTAGVIGPEDVVIESKSKS